MNERIKEELTSIFTMQFQAQPVLFGSPGRINIIGEHTDYNNGFVLPAAIDKAVYVAISKREDSRVHLYAADLKESIDLGLDEIRPVSQNWANYILGVVAQMQKRSLPVGGFNMAMTGDVPIGSGLSSSAAVECATAIALNSIFGLKLNNMELALLAQKAEHEFAGVLCGIMDQFASVFGKKDHVIRLDCRSMEYEYVPLRLDGYKIVLLNTNVSHSLASSEYNTRRGQCEAGVQMVQQRYPEVKSLRDVTLQMLDEQVRPNDPLIYKRCAYVVRENQRLLEGCEDLIQGRIDALGQKMFETHEGLSKDYEVSCPELDFLVENVRMHPGVIGARMMGGGFGGCTINIVQNDLVDTILPELAAAYEQAMGRKLSNYIVQTANGSGPLD